MSSWQSYYDNLEPYEEEVDEELEEAKAEYYLDAGLCETDN